MKNDYAELGKLQVASTQTKGESKKKSSQEEKVSTSCSTEEEERHFSKNVTPSRHSAVKSLQFFYFFTLKKKHQFDRAE